MNRRVFLGISAGLACSARTSIPIIDTHIHLFDTTRAKGVPWPEKTQTELYKPALPDRYRGIAGPWE